jgi:hypothetical protein
MEPSMEWVPMRWPSGPLEIALRERAGRLTREATEALQKWHDPSTLALLEGTPVSCLLVGWASGLPADSGQQQTLKPLIERGRKAGLSFVGLIASEADKTAAIAAAKAAGLSAVATEENTSAGNSGLPVIPWTKSAEAQWDAATPVLAVTDALWPRVQAARGSDMVGGPTGLPWVESNGAFLTIARVLAPAKTVWLALELPKDTQILTAEAYMVALADSAVYGGRWVITLDDKLRGGLAASSAEAIAAWKKITRTLAFFEQRQEITTYPPGGLLGVISNFAGPDRELGEEVLNLLPRRRLPFRAIAKSQALNASFSGLDAVYYVDREPPDPRLRQKLIAFAKGGGVLFVPAQWPNPEGSPANAEPYFVFNLRALGQGRVAVAKGEYLDPDEVASDIHAIMSHRRDLLRLFNATAVNCSYKVVPGGSQAVVQLLNYTGRPSQPAALWMMKGRYRSARFTSPETASPITLELTPRENGGVEMNLPSMPVCGVIELAS